MAAVRWAVVVGGYGDRLVVYGGGRCALEREKAEALVYNSLSRSLFIAAGQTMTLTVLRRAKVPPLGHLIPNQSTTQAIYMDELTTFLLRFCQRAFLLPFPDLSLSFSRRPNLSHLFRWAW